MINFIKAKQDFVNSTEGWNNEKWNDHPNNPFCLWSPELDNRHIKNCRLLKNRDELLKYLPQNSVVAEVGTQNGYFSEKIISLTNPQKFHLLDISFSDFKKRIEAEEKGILKPKIQQGLIELHKGDSSTILSQFPDEYFDWIYIDADHSYEGVCKDIYQGYKKVKKNGIIVFNDYTNWSIVEIMPYGVAKAINEFCINYDWEIIFFALHGFGYHDIAIRKIDEQNNFSIQDSQNDSELTRMQLQIQQLQNSLEQARQQIQEVENSPLGKIQKSLNKFLKLDFLNKTDQSNNQ